MLAAQQLPGQHRVGDAHDVKHGKPDFPNLRNNHHASQSLMQHQHSNQVLQLTACLTGPYLSVHSVACRCSCLLLTAESAPSSLRTTGVLSYAYKTAWCMTTYGPPSYPYGGPGSPERAVARRLMSSMNCTVRMALFRHRAIIDMMSSAAHSITVNPIVLTATYLC